MPRLGLFVSNNFFQTDINILPAAGLVAMDSDDVICVRNDGFARDEVERPSFVGGDVTAGKIHQRAIDKDFDCFIVEVAHPNFRNLSGGDFAGVEGAAHPDIGSFPFRAQFADIGRIAGAKSTFPRAPFRIVEGLLPPCRSGFGESVFPSLTDLF